MRISDLFLAFPGLVFALAVAAVHYVLGLVAFAVLAMYLPKIGAMINITE